MTNETLELKFKQRLNKLASNDYDNIECWQIVESFNKAQLEWCRRQLHGTNIFKEGDEQSNRRIDDLQLLLNDSVQLMNIKDLYVESKDPLPDNYLAYKRISAYAKKECCDNKILMTIYLAQEDNRDNLLRDHNKKPSYEWAESFATLIDNKFRIYTNNDFVIDSAIFTYYRKPRNIEILNCVDPYTLTTSTNNITCELKDDIIELLIDEAVSIVAGDIESPIQMPRGSQEAERNN